MSTHNIIFKIQDDYFKLLQDSLLSTQLESFLTLSTDDLREYIKKLLEPSGLVMPGRHYSRSSFENQINDLLVSIGRFWNRHSKELLTNLITLDAYKITLQSQHFFIDLENNIKKLGVYFDTIAIVDPLHLAPTARLESFLADDQLSNKLVLSERLALTLRLSKLNTPNVDKPIFMILPDSFSMDYIFDSALDEAVYYMSENIFKDGVINNYGDFHKQIDDTSDDKILPLIKDNNLLNYLVDRFNKPKEKTWAINRVDGDLQIFDSGFKELPLEAVMFTILYYLRETIANIRETLGNSLYYRADPVIFVGNIPVYKWLQHRIGEKLKHDLERSGEEQIVANALIKKDLSFLEALTLDDLKALRQDGLLETLREKLRIERKDLKSVPVDAFQESTNLFSTKLLNIVIEYSNEYSNLKQSNKKRITKSSLIFGGSAALGIAGLACPSIEVLAIIGTATGLLVGGKSVLDLVNDFNKLHKDVTLSESNPVSILYGAYERYMNLLDFEN